MSSQSRSRWFRFSLRSLLVLIVVFAIPIAWIAKERRQSTYELNLAEQLRKQGFSDVQLKGPYDTWDLTSKGQPPGWWRDRARQLLGDRVFLLGDAKPEVNDLAPIAGCTNLQGLAAIQTGVHDLTPLAKLHNLKILWLDHTQVRDLTPLAGLTKLKYLTIRGTKVSDLSPLVRLTSLESLDVCDTQVGDEQIAKLQQALPNCHIHRNMKIGPP